MNATTNPVLTTDEVFLRAPRLNKDDICEPLSEHDTDLIEQFEDAWKEFLSARRGTLPPGQKIKNCRNIQARMNEMEGKKQNVCLELQRQLDFFDSSRDKLEEKYGKEKEEATAQQNDLIAKLEQEIDEIAIADKALSEILPWEHFFDNLESNTTMVHNGSVASLSAATGQSQPIKPSGEALYLANIQPSELVYAARRGKSKAHLLRAYRIDNALLKAKAGMLRREVDRVGKTIRSDQLISNFLMENDIWGTMVESR
mmetsp:Transcript_30132/g.64592  ORF Transcript_30132/g.64592 Transcript_30132/m.64592 type:complete len:257 (+) Transcript_30132:86-856(+)